MCGIAGVLYRDHARPPAPSVLRQMGNAIAHRGPDGSGVYTSDGIGLIHRRLAIIDLHGGQQPIANEDESVHVVFNGEIYNYRELRNGLEKRGHIFRTWSDTEVLVHLYEDEGAELCRRLRGMFAFAIWDTRRQTLLLGRDHLGQKPLFVYRDQEKLLFGSELKAILAHPAVDRSIQPSAVEDYITFGFVPGGQCVLAAAEKLPAAHSLTVARDHWDASAQRYWQLQFEPDNALSESEWLEQTDAAIRDSVQAHLVSDVPVGAFLSGGIDSGAIVATVAELSTTPLQTFSIGFNEERFSELPEAAAVADHFGCQHTTEIVTPDAIRDLADLVHLYDEPFADASAIPTMAVSRLAARHVKVALSGDGGDELFAGYWRYRHDLREAQIREWLPAWTRRALLSPLAAIWPRMDWLPRGLRLQSLLQNLSASPASAYANTVSLCRREVRRRILRPEFAALLRGHRPEAIIESCFQHGSGDQLNGMLSADCNVMLPDDFLTKVDRASMGCGLEVRPPFVDRALMELAAKMPASQKIRDGRTKWILKQLFETRLPPKHAQRAKKGFEIPTDDWLRGPLRDQVHEVLLRPDSTLTQFVRPEAIRRLYAAHCRGTGRHGQLIWSLLVLGCWLARWQQPGGPSAIDVPDSLTPPTEPVLNTMELPA
jgi:asparagine synthase (glutamine-hydrolysing)